MGILDRSNFPKSFEEKITLFFKYVLGTGIAAINLKPSQSQFAAQPNRFDEHCPEPERAISTSSVLYLENRKLSLPYR